MDYVTYDENGMLTGGFCQELHPDHADCYIEVDAEQRLNWTAYRANDSRDGLELLPSAPLPVAVPTRVSRRQARQALLLAGLLDGVQPAIDAIPDQMARRMAQIWWDDSQEFERNHTLVESIGAVLRLNAAGLDELFIRAGSLQ